MARIRTIKPEFPQSESMGRISREARLCFILLWTLVDDSGRTRASSRMLASLLYPYDDDAPALMESWLAELEDEGCIDRYEVSGNIYLQISKWLIHQKIDKPSASRLPEFVESSRILSKGSEGSSPDLVPSTVVSSTSTEDQKPSRAKKPREVPTKTDIAKTRHAEFKAAIGEYWVSRNTIEMPWGPAEGRNLEMWLRQTPNTTLEQFKALLRNRFRSEVNHSERPSRWMGNVTGFATGPLDKFGRPKASAISAPNIRYSDPEAMNAR